jgi:hypothetical protein
MPIAGRHALAHGASRKGTFDYEKSEYQTDKAGQA